MENLASDILAGAKEISEETGFSIRKVYDLAEAGYLPTFKLGGKIHARRSELRRRLSAETLVA